MKKPEIEKLEEKIKEDIGFYLLDADWPFPKNIKSQIFRVITKSFKQAKEKSAE